MTETNQSRICDCNKDCGQCFCIINKNKDNISMLLAEFRLWHRQWERYGEVLGSEEPMSVDDFVDKISKKYKVST